MVTVHNPKKVEKLISNFLEMAKKQATLLLSIFLIWNTPLVSTKNNSPYSVPTCSMAKEHNRSSRILGHPRSLFLFPGDDEHVDPVVALAAEPLAVDVDVAAVQAGRG